MLLEHLEGTLLMVCLSQTDLAKTVADTKGIRVPVDFVERAAARKEKVGGTILFNQ